VVLEVESPQIIHKTEVGGIILDLKSAEEVAKGFDAIMANVRARAPTAEVKGVIVRRMAPKGVETLIGMNRDPFFGPVIAFGSGGVLVELVRDVAFRIAPVSLEEAREMVESTKVYAILRGYRGQAEADVDAVVDTILRVSKLAMDIPEIASVDINPFFVYEKGKGGLAIDVKVILSERRTNL
jgi:acyl-CoA synthetase (NDP forming)